MKVKGKKELVKLPSVLPDKRDGADSVFLCRPMQSARRVLTIANFINAIRDSFQARFHLLSIIVVIISLKPGIFGLKFQYFQTRHDRLNQFQFFEIKKCIQKKVMPIFNLEI